MPLQHCEVEGDPGWKWGDAGKCYVYTAGDNASSLAAKKKALKQAAAMGDLPGTQNYGERPNGPLRLRHAQIADVKFKERIIDVLAAPYNEETALIAPNKRFNRELIERGAFDGIENRPDAFQVTVNRDHNPERVVGKIVSYVTDNPAGLIASAYISDTSLGEETLQLAKDGILKPSVGMLVRGSDQIIRNGLSRVRKAFLHHLAMLPDQAYQGAGVLAVRQEQLQVPAIEPVPTPNMDRIIELLHGQK